MKKYFFLIGIVLLTANSFSQKKLTLDESIQIALQRNSQLIQTQNSLEANKSNIKSAYGDLLPNFGASSSWGWSKITDKGSIQTDFFGVERRIPASETDTRNWLVSVGGGVTLFNGLANYASISKAENNYDAARYDILKLKQDIVLATAKLYYDVLEAESFKKFRQDNLKSLQKSLEQIQERYKLGAVAIADVYSQQFRVGTAELDLITTENQVDLAKNNLLNYLALDVLEDYEFVSPAEVSEFESEMDIKDFSEISSLVAEALDLRLDYKSKLLGLESAKNDITISRSGLFPRLSGSYSFSSGSTHPADLLDRNTYRIGLSLNIPIFDNWNTENSIQFSEINLMNKEEDLKVKERSIKIEVKQGYLNLVAGKKSYEVAAKNVQSAEENRRINYERYNLGSSTIIEVLQSDSDYTKALTDRIRAEYEYYRLRDNMLNVLGKLDFKKYE
ncbi:MAG: TolC family protein [Bacteroidetes bacterium]|nr:TolC family protein [Bacteroidota bacterium]MBU1677869.1 TolC family protein [Bacteroidota bacterium]MBU2505941.1 TolC family protein [Bacteroidota bacterium]